MMECLLIRHGETDYNKKKCFQGQMDVELNSTGMDQAKKLSTTLSDENISRVYSSDLKRCVKTAELLGFSDVIYKSEFREFDFGQWEGFTYEMVKDQYPGELEKWNNDYINHVIPGGESLTQMKDRVVKEFENIREKHKSDGDKIAIVAHGGSIKALLCHYILDSDINPWKFAVENCTITRLCFDKDFPYLKSLNEQFVSDEKS